MKRKLLYTLTLATALLPSASRAEETNKWTFAVTPYVLFVGMSGDLSIGRLTAPVNFGFDKVWDNLEFTAMGTVRVGYGPWALTTDVIYMGLGTSRNGLTVDMDQWMVEPTISYRVSKYFEPYAGVRYNNLSAEISGPLGHGLSGTQEWWDPVVGANLSLPLGKNFSLNVQGDIGGFGVGSDLAWQAYPYFGWQFAKWGSLQLGYRWLYMDYESDNGRFKYDILNQGPQVGITFQF